MHPFPISLPSHSHPFPIPFPSHSHLIPIPFPSIIASLQHQLGLSPHSPPHKQYQFMDLLTSHLITLPLPAPSLPSLHWLVHNSWHCQGSGSRASLSTLLPKAAGIHQPKIGFRGVKSRKVGEEGEWRGGDKMLFGNSRQVSVSRNPNWEAASSSHSHGCPQAHAVGSEMPWGEGWSGPISGLGHRVGRGDGTATEVLPGALPNKCMPQPGNLKSLFAVRSSLKSPISRALSMMRRLKD